MNGLNCDPMSFDKECSLTNAKFHKNKKSSEIKSHHYIISFDPDDRSECGLTGEKAQELCLDLDEYFYPPEKVEKSTIRRQTETSLDLLTDNELKIIQGTIDGILNSRGNKK